MIRHVQLGVVAGAALTRASVCLERITVENFNSGSVQYWLGVYTTTLGNDGQPVAPSANAIPVIEVALAETWESVQQFDQSSPLVPGPVYVALSTTENTYTATATTARIDVDYDELEIVPSGLTTETGASTNKLSVWNNASAPQALYDAFVTDLNNNAGAQLYLQLFAQETANVVNGLIPIEQWPLSIAGSTIGLNTAAGGQSYLNFGRTSNGGGMPAGGLVPYQTNCLISATAQEAGGTATVANAYQGCVLAVSTTSGTLTLAAANSAYITARYV